MKIFSAAQFQKWDAYTIAHEPIASVDLMERAATACYKWLIGKNTGQQHFRIFCGKGNNGGDGLAIARLLIQNNCSATVYILEFGHAGSPDFQCNLESLHECSKDIHFIQSPDFFPTVNEHDIIIDALFGTGLNKPPEGITAALISHINSFNNPVIAIDLPSGLFADKSSKSNTVIRATHTLSFQSHKLAFLVAENEMYCGEVHLLHIGLHPDFEAAEPAAFEITDAPFIKTRYKPRKKFSHKGTYGHAALIAGSYGMMGAAILSARACLRSGAGKLTCYIPGCGYNILQTAVPEAMCKTFGEIHISSAPGLDTFNAVGIGPGIGSYPALGTLLHDILKDAKSPLLLDADALNCIATGKDKAAAIPPGSVITPHPGEFDRLFGPAANDFDRIQLAIRHSKALQIYIVLKGHYTLICSPEGPAYFNSTGNPGMATAGSGDVLSGLITGLLAQGYTAPEACLLGTYLHGLAGDIAAKNISQEALVAGDIVDAIGDAFISISV